MIPVEEAPLVPARRARRDEGPTVSGSPGRRAPRAPARHVADLFARSGRPLFWLCVFFFILAPCASFLMLALSPRLFSEGSGWFTLRYLEGAFTGATGVALANSIWVSAAAAVLGAGVGIPIAWITHRTDLPGRRYVAGAMWVLLLVPSWLPAIGWERLVQPGGVMYRIGMNLPFVTSAIFGPFGVVLLLGIRCVPFTYLAVSAALGGLGDEFEDAARTHGATRWGALRLVLPILAPAITSALAIGFAESVSDFGVASTLAYAAHFSLATYDLYAAIGNFPPDFPAAAASGWLLIASVAIPLALQARALRGRTYAVLSGRTRPAATRHFTRRGRTTAIGALAGFLLVALGIPAFGAVSGSLLADFGASASFTFSNFRAVFADSGLTGPLERSLVYGAVTASITVVGGFAAARMLSRRRTKATQVLDGVLMAAVALPSVVFAAGYIFTFNLPILSRIGINLYQTTTLLIIGYAASALPTNARVLVGAASQIQDSLHDAARVHGSGSFGAWSRAVLPVVSRPITMAWLLTFSAVFLELPISQLLYAPGSPPVSVAIEDNLGNYHFGVGMAQAVLAVACALAAVVVVLGLFQVATPAGWRRGVRHRG